MKPLSYPILALFAAGCGGSYSQDEPFKEDTDGTTDSGGTEDSDADTDSDTDSDTDADTDTDTDTDSDTDSDTDTDTDSDTDADPEFCLDNAWNPITVAPYHREYVVTGNPAVLMGTADFGGSAGTGSGYNEDYGTGWADDGAQVYLVIDSIDVGGTGWDGETYIGCNQDGDEGQFIHEFDMSIVMMSSPIDTAWGKTNPPRKVMPAEYEVGYVGSWTYDDMTDVQGGLGTTTYRTAGAYVEEGMEDITLWDGTTVSAYKLGNTYSMEISSTLGASVVNGYQELWYVKGIGLAREVNTNTDDGSVIVGRELSSYTGLAPE